MTTRIYTAILAKRTVLRPDPVAAPGNDIIYGGNESDKLYGEADNDLLVDCKHRGLAVRRVRWQRQCIQRNEIAVHPHGHRYSA